MVHSIRRVLCFFHQFQGICGGIRKYRKKNHCKKPENRKKVAGLRKNFDKFQSAFTMVLSTAILERFNEASLNLQAMRMDLKSVLHIYKSSIDFVTELRTDKISQKFMNNTKEIIDVEDDEVGHQ